MCSIIFYIRFGIKIGYCFPGLFMSRNIILNCSISSVVSSDIDRRTSTLRFFGIGPSLQSFRVRLLRRFMQNVHLLLFRSSQENDLLHKRNISVHLNSSSKRPGSLLWCFLCILQHILGKKISVALAVKVSVQHPESIALQSLCFSRRNSFSKFSSDRVNSRESVSFSISLYLSASQNFLLKR